MSVFSIFYNRHILSSLPNIKGYMKIKDVVTIKTVKHTGLKHVWVWRTRVKCEAWPLLLHHCPHFHFTVTADQQNYPPVQTENIFIYIPHKFMVNESPQKQDLVYIGKTIISLFHLVHLLNASSVSSSGYKKMNNASFCSLGASHRIMRQLHSRRSALKYAKGYCRDVNKVPGNLEKERDELPVKRFWMLERK